ncbi:hypothetical protein BDQ17DRAFT_1363267, partial [Cyathus striatus]
MSWLLYYATRNRTGALKFKPKSVSNIRVVFLRCDIFILPNSNNLSLDMYYIPPSSSSSNSLI